MDVNTYVYLTVSSEIKTKKVIEYQFYKSLARVCNDCSTHLNIDRDKQILYSKLSYYTEAKYFLFYLMAYGHKVK